MRLSAWYHGAWAVFRSQISCMVVEFHLQMVSVLEGKLPLSSRKNIQVGVGKIWVFPKIGVPQDGWCIMETLWKWKICGYPYFWKHPYCYFGQISWHFANLVPTQTFGAPELDKPGVEPDAHGELLLRWDDPVMMFQMKRSEDHFELEGFNKKDVGQLRLFGLKWCLFIHLYINCMWSKWPMNWFDRWSS